MKLTNREKKLIISFVVAGAIVGTYLYGYSPVKEQHDEAKNKYEIKKSEYDSIMSKIEDDAIINARLEEFQFRVAELEEKLPGEVHQEVIIMDVKKIFDDHDVRLQSMSFDNNRSKDEEEETDSLNDIIAGYNNASDYQSQAFQNFSQVIETGTTETADSEVEEKVSYFQCNLSFETNYKVLKSIMAKFQEREQIIINGDLNIAKTGLSKDGISVTMSLKFPFSPDYAQLRDPNWYNENTYEEGYDPFDYYMTSPQTSNPTSSGGSSSSGGVIAEKPVVEKPQPVEVTPSSLKSDFDMSLTTYTSDLPTAGIYRSGVSYATLYADETDPVFIDMILKKEAGKYYYRYNTPLQYYPSQNGFEEFSPVNKEYIVVEVYSTYRVNEMDNSGVKFRVENNTDLNLDIHTFGDDPSKPRLTLIKQSGNAQIINH